jgi:hypothetical protein
MPLVVFPSLNELALGVFGEAAERLDELHILDRVAAGLEETRRATT